MESDVIPDLFWELSIGEIVDLIQSKTKKIVKEMKLKARFDESLADQIAERVGIILSGKKDIEPLKLYDRFPTLFEDEIKIAKELQKQKDLELYKAQFENYVYRMNKKFERKEQAQWME